MRRIVRFGLCVFAFWSIGCSRGDTPTVASTPPAPASLPSEPSRAVEVLRRHETFAAHLSRAQAPQLDGDGLHIEQGRPTALASERLRVRLPLRSDGPVRLTYGSREGDAIVLRALDVSATDARIDGNAVVFESARPSTDVLHLIERGRFEENRVLHDASAPSTHRWSIELGARAVDVRVRDGLVEVLDAQGRALIVGHPAFAEDGSGITRKLETSVTGSGSARTLTLSLDTSGLRYPIVVDPTWTVVAPMAYGHFRAGATPLPSPDTRILVVAGGRVGATSGYSVAELYDPKLNRWASAGALPGLAATVTGWPGNLHALSGGGAVIAGGPTPVLASTYSAVWDGATTWKQTTGQLGAARGAPMSVALKDGTILIVGGGQGTYGSFVALSSSEIYNPTLQKWTPTTNSMTAPRPDASAMLLPSGKVMVAGGDVVDVNANPVSTLSSVDIFDPTTGTWSPGPALPGPRSYYTTMTLASGAVQLIDGFPTIAGVMSNLFDRITFTEGSGWGTPIPLPGVIVQGGSFPLADGRTLFTTALDATIYDPATDTFTWAGTAVGNYAGRAGAPLADGRFLIAGGRTGSGASAAAVSEAEIWGQALLGAACVDDFECKSGHCTDGICCGVARCASGSTCAGAAPDGTCHKTSGQTCSAAAECATGNCVDGVCCNTACAGQCQACDDPYSLGTCTAVVGAPHGSKLPCSDGGGDPCKATACNGTDAAACHAVTGTISCGTAACVAGVESHVGTCDTTGVCNAPKPKSCGIYACGGTTCKTTCATSADCASGYWCSSGACTVTLGLGTACVDATSCATGTTCVEGFCCGSAVCSAGSSCALPGHEGTCTKKQGTACTVDTECATGLCVDGVCCASACSHQCEACDAKGSEGTCVAVTGAPHGSRAACAKDPTDPCKSAACDGSTTASCAGLAGSDVVCQAATCSSGTFTPKAVCDGKGNCAKATMATCNGFVCSSPQTCRTVCKDNGDCLPGYHCAGATCIATTDTCSADGTSRVPAGGTAVACAPYVCVAGACLSACGTTADCQSGNECSFATRTCVPSNSANSASRGGCSASARGAGAASWWFGGLAVTLLLARRRRELLVALAASSAACSGDRAGPGTTAHEQTSGETLARPPERPELSALASVRRAAPALRRFGSGTLRWNGHQIEPATPSRDLSVKLSVDGTLQLGSRRDPSLQLDIVELDIVGGTSSQIVEGALHRRAASGSPLWVAPTAEGVEQIRVLEDASQPGRMQMRVVPGAGLSVRVRQGRIEAVDQNGRVSIGSAPVWAIDANGQKRWLAVEVLAREGRGIVVEATLDTTGLSYPIVIDPAWSEVATMTHPRCFHSAVALPGNKLLVAGGIADLAADTRAASTSAEIYDATANTWTSTGNLAFAHAGAAAALIGGKVILAGGNDGSPASTSNAEQFDPSTGKWTAIAPMPEVRDGHYAANLSPTRALFFNGEILDASSNQTATQRTFLYDATTGWKETGLATDDRSGGAYAQLADGSVIAMGGSSANTGDLSSAERYDPTLGTWAAIAPLAGARLNTRGMAFASGKKAIVVGGQASSAGAFPPGLSTTEIYDTASKTWRAGPSLGTFIEAHQIVPLPSGRLLLATGTYHARAATSYEVFDPASSAFTTVGRTIDSVAYSTLTTLTGGTVVLTGGFSAAGGAGSAVTTNRVELFAPQANGMSCVGPDECTSGNCVDGVCCSTATCAPGSVCNGPSSLGTCAENNGIFCTSASQCANGNCVDGYCCESGCTDTCAACDVPGHLGRCRPVTGAPHGARTACTATPTDCGLTCDGADTTTCHNRKSGAVCGTAGCKAATLTHVSTCDGSGSCSDVPTPCGGYACDAAGVSCLTSCSKSADCTTGYTCAGGACTPLPGKGLDCSKTGACGASLTCLKGVCCSTASCPADSVCPLGGGDCVKVDGAVCSKDADCQHGHCVDSTCCNEACAGTCGACDVAGQEGKCVAVIGKPHGSRSCSTGSSDPCATGVCDGAEKSTCANKPGAETQCRAASCGGGSATTSAYCDGSGACPPAVTSNCGSYACNGDGTACRTRCDVATDCAANAFCNDGKCQPLAGTCTSDGSSLQVTGAGTLSCAPYACVGNACATQCMQSTDCAAGAACDSASKTCIAGSPHASGGCATRTPTGALGGGAWELVAIGLGILGRRRRFRDAMSDDIRKNNA